MPERFYKSLHIFSIFIAMYKEIRVVQDFCTFIVCSQFIVAKITLLPAVVKGFSLPGMHWSCISMLTKHDHRCPFWKRWNRLVSIHIMFGCVRN